jgi:hypothetical protein
LCNYGGTGACRLCIENKILFLSYGCEYKCPIYNCEDKTMLKLKKALKWNSFSDNEEIRKTAIKRYKWIIRKAKSNGCKFKDGRFV